MSPLETTTRRDLETTLLNKGVPLQKWGRNDKGDLAELQTLLNNGERVFEAAAFRKLVLTARRAMGDVLHELDSGMHRAIKAGSRQDRAGFRLELRGEEAPYEALLQFVQTELGWSSEFHGVNVSVQEVNEESKRFPGLIERLRTFTYKLRLVDPEDITTSRSALPEISGQYRWVLAPRLSLNSSAFRMD